MENLEKGNKYDSFDCRKYRGKCYQYYTDNIPDPSSEISIKKATAFSRGFWLLL